MIADMPEPPPIKTFPLSRLTGSLLLAGAPAFAETATDNTPLSTVTVISTGLRGHRRLTRRYSAAQSRAEMPFSWAYAADLASINGRKVARSAWTQSVTSTHFCPSHCCTRAEPPPSWSAQDSFNG